MPSKCDYYYRLQERGVTAAAAKKWLKGNPPPRNWKHSAWRWAYEQMEVA
ncbi:hypothetical protein Tgr7_1658 [Thioalkalivibrio sulfidiphilus HL-EbGr7]|uniref:Uncharacterized protein n=1 Tax=Thioalkalivibrio sulfidiphilus (strain HL-EbGR7) TaxID=396588 RepID=B8GS37_THISH|nr:hypothetical protein [Thioalkalivibrio sulfidiphilus]ACL72741.1 hypothetical protein Tgr7_1658 [Thioalkalivibrio sulfidiphilus HL-EbGr7]